MSLFKRLYKQNKYLPAFIVSSGLVLAIIVLAFVVLSVVKGSLYEAYKYISRYCMSDFGQVVYFTLSENPYVAKFSTTYLPLNFIFMYPFALICKNNPAFYKLDDIGVLENGAYVYEDLLSYNIGILATWQFWVAMFVFIVVNLSIIGLILYKLKKWDSKADFFLAYFAFVCSAFVAFGLFRGTNVFQSLIFIMLFVWLYKSPKKWQREISLLCLAIAGVLKIYPLLFGVLLLKDKRFVCSLKVALYTAILTFIPFIIYGSDVISTFKAFCVNLLGFVEDEGRLGSAMNISIHSLICWVFALFGAGASKFGSIIGLSITIITFVICVYVSLKTKSQFVLYFVIAIGMILIPPVSYYYVSMFMIFPLLLFIKEWNEIDKPRKIYYTIFFITMSFLPLSATMWYIPQSVMMAVILVWELVRLFPKRKTTEEIS